jgi:threonine synthase
MARITYLECTKCGHRLTADLPRTLCPKDAGSLYVRYEFEPIRNTFTRESLVNAPKTMWRYAPALPSVEPVSLGEGFTPLLKSRHDPNVYVKDEGLNPTGSFKARGLCAAVTMAKAYGIQKVAIPSAGNAAGALAAYAAAAGIEAHIFMPKDVPQANSIECEAFGAKVTLVDGLISDCARMVGERKQSEGWFDISTLKEPFRVEGKKTMGYEIVEQLDWKMPDAVIYPTGGGVGLIGMWKAFEEMEYFGWVGKERPKMITVQASGCAPISKAWEEGKPVSEMWQNAQTIASGLRVPKAYADYVILDILKQSGGAAVTVTDDEMMDALFEWAADEGIFAAPEGAASLFAYRKLRASGFLKESDTVVLFNTGSGYKYIDVIAEYMGKKSAASNSGMAKPQARQVGGIITPF